MGFYGLNWIALLIIFFIALLLFGSSYLYSVVEDIVSAIYSLCKTVKNKRNKKPLDEDSSKTDIASG